MYSKIRNVPKAYKAMSTLGYIRVDKRAYYSTLVYIKCLMTTRACENGSKNCWKSLSATAKTESMLLAIWFVCCTVCCLLWNRRRRWRERRVVSGENANEVENCKHCKLRRWLQWLQETCRKALMRVRIQQSISLYASLCWHNGT